MVHHGPEKTTEERQKQLGTLITTGTEIFYDQGPHQQHEDHGSVLHKSHRFLHILVVISNDQNSLGHMNTIEALDLVLLGVFRASDFNLATH